MRRPASSAALSAETGSQCGLRASTYCGDSGRARGSETGDRDGGDVAGLVRDSNIRRRIWDKRGAGEVKGRTALRRARIVLAFGVLLGAGLLTSCALGDTGLQGIFTSSGSATDTTFSSGPAGTTGTLSLLTLNPTIDSDQPDYN